LNLIDILETSADKAGGKVFLQLEKDKRTFKRVYEDVLKFASGLSSLGVKKGDRVAMLLNNSLEFVTAYFASVYLGAEIIPLNTFLRIEEVNYILNDCKAKIFITSSDFSGILKELNLSRVPSVEWLVSTDPVIEKHILFRDLFKNEKAQKVDITEDDTAAIIYTSGTTGFPKGAMLTHRNLFADIKSSCEAIKVSSRDRFILFLPMFHAFSFTVCVLIPVYKMCYTRIMKSVLPFSNIISSLVFDRITIFVAIPQVFSVLSAKKIPRISLWLICIRICISGAAPLSGDVLGKFQNKFGIPLLEGYGLSEASPVVSVNPIDGVRKAGSVGPAIPRVTVAILDDDGHEMKRGEAGEIVVRGENIMKGYFNKPVETAEVIRDGWLYTGDIGRMDDDGYIFIMDRKKDMLIVNGMNLYPREVEEVLYMHEAVEEAAVVGKKDAVHGEIPIGVIKFREGKTVTDPELRKFCRNHLANFKVPHRFEFWSDLPKNGTGKILKREIKRLLNEKK
jgi:long-chain acyl-CoA synthetase